MTKCRHQWLQDIAELRYNRWVARRAVEGPKTIEQIHKDAAREQLHQKAMADPRGGPRGGRDSFMNRPAPMPAPT